MLGKYITVAWWGGGGLVITQIEVLNCWYILFISCRMVVICTWQYDIKGFPTSTIMLLHVITRVAYVTQKKVVVGAVSCIH